EKAYKFNGEEYVQFYQKPWMVDAFWAAEVSGCDFLVSLKDLKMILVKLAGSSSSKARMLLHICQQVETIFFWYPKSICCSCQKCKSSGFHQRWYLV
ncbi:hypothetical protein C8R44DRAFT_601647, partial [Mycena epipterygia]